MDLRAWLGDFESPPETSRDASLNNTKIRVWRKRRKSLVVLAILVYISSFQWMYVHWLTSAFGYFGFDYIPPMSGSLYVAWILALLPALWMPIRLLRPSQLAYWVLYVTVFIPSMFVPLYAGLTARSEILYLLITMFAGFALLGANNILPLARIRPPRLTPVSFWTITLLVGVALAAWVVFLFRGNLQIVSLLDVYDVRGAADDLLDGTKGNYALMWLSGALNPLLMAYGLFQKRLIFVVAGIFGQLLVYSSLATKGSILSIAFILGFYVLLKGDKGSFGLKLALGASVLGACLCLSYWLAGGDNNPIYSTILFVVFMRTLSSPGLLTAQYYDFFSFHSLTHYSHVTGVNWFTTYPYANPIGVEVGSFYSGDPTLDASAHFWATDGIAAWGLLGVLLISVFCAILFWCLDSAAQNHDPRFSALAISYAAYNLANISIFTSLLSGGLSLLILALYFMPRQCPPEETRTPQCARLQLRPAPQP